MKIKHFILTMMLSLGVMFLVGCDGGSSSDGGSKKPTKIVVIGDSIGTGFGLATGFPVFLESMAGVTVINNSKNDRLTSEGVGLASSLIAEHEPSHLVVLLGTNDAIRGSMPGARDNLQTIANIGKDAGVRVVIGTLPPITRSSSEDDRAAEISSGIRGLNNARIANLRPELDADTIADGVHPNNAGQQIIAMNFFEKL